MWVGGAHPLGSSEFLKQQWIIGHWTKASKNKEVCTLVLLGSDLFCFSGVRPQFSWVSKNEITLPKSDYVMC